MSDNGELFEAFAGLMLAQLFATHPVPVRIEGQPPSTNDLEKDEVALHNRVWLWTREWLVAEGYIRTTGLIDYVLTEKGYTTLKALPDPLTAKNPAESYGKKMVDAAKDGASEGVKGIAKGAVNEVGGVFAEYLGRIAKGYMGA